MEGGGRDVDVIDQMGQGQREGVQRGQWPHAGMALKSRRGRLGGRSSDIGLHVQQGRMSIFMGKPGRYSLPLLGSVGKQKGRKTSQRDLQPIPLLPSSQRVPRPLLTPGTSPALSFLSSQTPWGHSHPFLLQTLELICICQDS